MIKNQSISFVAEEEGRVDKVSTIYVKRTIFSSVDTQIYINDKKEKKSTKVKIGDNVKIDYTIEFFENLKAKDIKLNIIYEDDDILVINKDVNLVVHPGAGNYEDTIVNALLYRYGADFNTSSDDLRPGIVHRLDKDTSGVMVIAKTESAHTILSKQFFEHTNEKVYICIAKGFFSKSSGVINSNIKRDDKNRKLYTTCEKGGKEAYTEYKVLRQFDNYALVRLIIKTGRTHQIRVHLKSINHPILGDEQYSRSDKKYSDCLCLHALSLSFNHPKTNERLSFIAPMPKRIKDFIDLIK